MLLRMSVRGSGIRWSGCIQFRATQWQARWTRALWRAIWWRQWSPSRISRSQAKVLSSLTRTQRRTARKCMWNMSVTSTWIRDPYLRGGCTCRHGDLCKADEKYGDSTHGASVAPFGVLASWRWCKTSTWSTWNATCESTGTSVTSSGSWRIIWERNISESFFWKYRWRSFEVRRQVLRICECGHGTGPRVEEWCWIRTSSVWAYPRYLRFSIQPLLFGRVGHGHVPTGQIHRQRCGSIWECWLPRMMPIFSARSTRPTMLWFWKLEWETKAKILWWRPSEHGRSNQAHQ